MHSGFVAAGELVEAGGHGPVSLALLAAASVAVAITGRMAAQTRRAALLKAIGATPRFVAAVMLAEHLVFGLAAGVAGLVAGSLLAPLLAEPVPGVLGSASVATPSRLPSRWCW